LDSGGQENKVLSSGDSTIVLLIYRDGVISGRRHLYAALEIFFWNVFVNRAMEERMFFQSSCNERKCFHDLCRPQRGGAPSRGLVGEDAKGFPHCSCSSLGKNRTISERAEPV
jgi:hypothetical protein